MPNFLHSSASGGLDGTSQFNTNISLHKIFTLVTEPSVLNVFAHVQVFAFSEGTLVIEGRWEVASSALSSVQPDIETLKSGELKC